MHLELYETLGFDNNEVPYAELKAAYRTLSKTCHPDKFPGDKSKEEEFIKLKKAWEILKDSEKRAEYDESGLMLDSKDKMVMLEGAKNNIIGIYMAVMEQIQESQIDHFDFKKTVLSNIQGNENQVSNKMDDIRRKMLKIEKSKQRLSFSGKEDFLMDAINKKVMELENELNEHAKMLKVLSLMTELISDYEYDFIKPQPTVYNNSTNTSTVMYRRY